MISQSLNQLLLVLLKDIIEELHRKHIDDIEMVVNIVITFMSHQLQKHYEILDAKTIIYNFMEQ